MGPITEYFGSLAVLGSVIIIAFKLRTIRKRFFPFAMLEVVLPVTAVLGAVHVLVDSVSISFIVFPITVEHVTIRMPELPRPLGLPLRPAPFILGAVDPNLFPVPVSSLPQPLALVDGPVAHQMFRFVFCEHAFIYSRVGILHMTRERRLVIRHSFLNFSVLFAGKISTKR